MSRFGGGADFAPLHGSFDLNDSQLDQSNRKSTCAAIPKSRNGLDPDIRYASKQTFIVEVTGAERLFCAASIWTAGLGSLCN